MTFDGHLMVFVMGPAVSRTLATCYFGVRACHRHEDDSSVATLAVHWVRMAGIDD